MLDFNIMKVYTFYNFIRIYSEFERNLNIYAKFGLYA